MVITNRDRRTNEWGQQTKKSVNNLSCMLFSFSRFSVWLDPQVWSTPTCSCLSFSSWVICLSWIFLHLIHRSSCEVFWIAEYYATFPSVFKLFALSFQTLLEICQSVWSGRPNTAELQVAVGKFFHWAVAWNLNPQERGALLSSRKSARWWFRFSQRVICFHSQHNTETCRCTADNTENVHIPVPSLPSFATVRAWRVTALWFISERSGVRRQIILEAVCVLGSFFWGGVGEEASRSADIWCARPHGFGMHPAWYCQIHTFSQPMQVFDLCHLLSGLWAVYKLHLNDMSLNIKLHIMEIIN